MGELKLYSVSDEYISFLQNMTSGVYSNKQDTRKHTRKYLGVALSNSGYNYYIPLSSPKRTHLQTMSKPHWILNGLKYYAICL